MSHAVGRIVDVECAGVAPPDGPFAGQELYRERAGRTVFGGWLIPEQDLDFLE